LKKASIFLVLSHNLDIKLGSQVSTLCAVQDAVLSSKSFRYSGGAKLTGMAVMRRFHAVRQENISIVGSCKVGISV
jgi:hypothetical protein